MNGESHDTGVRGMRRSDIGGWLTRIGAAAAVVAAACVAGPVAAAPAGAATRAAHQQHHADAANPCATATGAPGVTAHAINVGALSTLTGPIASNFESLVPGIRAYLQWYNATYGGVYGRKVNLTYSTDDTGNPSQDVALAHSLIDQDKVFAVAGVATAFFTPTYFVQTCTPTFGYNVTGNWSGPPNLFAAGGSVQDYAAGTPAWTYLVHKTQKSPKVGVLAYNIAASNDSCRTAIQLWQKAGIDVAYQDLSIGYGSSVIPDTERMKAAGVNFILSCMDVTGNISLARGVQQYGIKATQLWLNGNDQSTLDQYQNLMQGVYFNIQHVPFDASTSTYPGLGQYLAGMRKYQPKYVYDEVAIQGWESAALLVAGLKAAGPHPTQAGVVNAINKMTAFTAGGLTTPTDWSPSGGGHNYPITSPTCSAYIQVKGDKFVTVLVKKPQVFLCFKVGTTNPDLGLGSYVGPVKNAVPVTPPPGTPGA